jgi:hypothetical protein
MQSPSTSKEAPQRDGLGQRHVYVVHDAFMFTAPSIGAQFWCVHADQQVGREDKDAVGRREEDLVSALRDGVTAGRRQLSAPPSGFQSPCR